MNAVLDAIVRGLLRLLPGERRRQLSFTWSYRSRNTPWDTGITPPEVVEFARTRSPGRALDLGCGTGTNTIYLACNGWESIGVDYVPTAIALAKRKAAQRSVPARFYQGDVTHLEDLPIEGPFDYLLDIGCMHSLTEAGQERYAGQLSRLAAPGACYMLYAGLPRRSSNGNLMGITQARVRELFSPHFVIERAEAGTDNAGGWTRVWYWMRRQDPTANQPQ